MLDLKPLCTKWNGHNAFAHPLNFDELLQIGIFSFRIKISHFSQR